MSMVTGPFSTQNLPTKIHTNWGKKFTGSSTKVQKHRKYTTALYYFVYFNPVSTEKKDIKTTSFYEMLEIATPAAV